MSATFYECLSAVRVLGVFVFFEHEWVCFYRRKIFSIDLRCTRNVCKVLEGWWADSSNAVAVIANILNSSALAGRLSLSSERSHLRNGRGRIVKDLLGFVDFALRFLILGVWKQRMI